MSVTLACTWRPHGEMPRFQKMYPHLRQAYGDVVIAVPGEVDPADLAVVKALANSDGVSVIVPPDRTQARHAALRASLGTPGSHIHYVDMDRLLRWAETRPGEWRQTIETIQTTDCLIIGRTPAAFATHPQALQKTEEIINLVFSHLLGVTVDLCSGSKGFSRRAGEFLITNTAPGHWSDAEWPMRLHRAGYRLETAWVDGLDWETADRHRPDAADPETQRRLAARYDDKAKNWEFRIQIALDIVREGLAVMQGSDE
ncbi:MAG TPA: hypothetical protein VIK33_16135 [Anaerolineae bacterium]